MGEIKTILKALRPIKTKMNQGVKSLWVEALRSGNYKQGKYRLKSGNSFCALGVLCDISHLGEWNGTHYVTKTDENNFIPPYEVQKWANMNGFKVFKTNIPSMNEMGLSFNQIANIIERHM